MKFSVSSSALLSLLATTGKVISNKNTLPILDYFLMELNGNELKVTTSDLETTLIGSITVDSVESEGTIAAPAKLMLDSLKEFSELPLTIDVNDKNWEITINWKSGSLSIPGASAVSYPAVPQLSAEKKELRLDVDMLVNGINKTIFATADDELRPVMNGIYINLAPGALTFVGTDAHKPVDVAFGIREAYETGRGALTTRSVTHIENVTARKKAIVVTELPFMVGPERVLERISEGVKNRKLEGISGAIDLTDRHNGTRLVIEIKTGFDPNAVLEQLYRLTPLEDSFGINHVALVGGQPQTLGLKPLLALAR